MITYTARSRYGDIRLQDVRVPTLQGTEAQVAWAIELRSAEIHLSLERLIASPRQIEAVSGDMIDILDAIRAKIEGAVMATDWIDGRHCPTWILRAAARDVRVARAKK